MLPILSASQIREADRYTIAHEPVSSIDLMERASMAACGWLCSRFSANSKIGIICGTGNNGGDGLGIARLLQARGYDVRVWVVRGNTPTSDFEKNYQRVADRVPLTDIVESQEMPSFAGCDVLVDALLGSGLSRPLEGLFAGVAKRFNQIKCIKVAIDIPSGLPTDSMASGPVMHCDHTLTFQLPRLSFMFPDAAPAVGDWTVLDIGLDMGFIGKQETAYHYFTREDASDLFKARARFDHKGKYGRALVVAGSEGKMGAAVLATRACLRAGAGLTTTLVPGTGLNILQTAAPEAMAMVAGESYWTKVPSVEQFDAIGLGPGMGQDPATAIALGKLLNDYRKPVVLDADALNILALNRHWMSLIPEGSILTPHPGEFARLTDEWHNDVERLNRLRELSKRTRSVVVLKGAHTAVATPDGRVTFNSTGNPGMAKGGSGDALTGILTALLAQGYEPVVAARLGVWWHGAAGDVAVKTAGEHSMLATDLIEALGTVTENLK
ncbi:MAG: NAD(P)H-hydrate dehydratase [Cyclobacteriaceae bacterium]